MVGNQRGAVPLFSSKEMDNVIRYEVVRQWLTTLRSCASLLSDVASKEVFLASMCFLTARACALCSGLNVTRLAPRLLYDLRDHWLKFWSCTCAANTTHADPRHVCFRSGGCKVLEVCAPHPCVRSGGSCAHQGSALLRNGNGGNWYFGSVCYSTPYPSYFFLFLTLLSLPRPLHCLWFQRFLTLSMTWKQHHSNEFS